MRHWQRNLYVIAIAEFFTILGFNAVLPFLPYYIQELGVTDLEQVAIWAGLLSSGPAFMMAIFSPIWGAVADRYGRKLMLERAIFAAALILGLMSLARNVHQLLVIRIFQGCLTGTVSAATTLVATTTPRNKMGYGLGVIQMSVFAGASFGPLVGGLIADHVGYRPVFWLTSFILLLSGLGILLLVSENFKRGEAQSSETKRGFFQTGVKDLLRSPQLVIVILIALVVRLADQSVKPILPLFIQSLIPEGGKPASIAGSIAAVSAIMSGLAAIFAGRRGDSLGYRKILLLCTTWACIFLIPQALVQEIWQLFLLRALVGACVGGTLPMVNAVIAATVTNERQGAAYGLNASAASVGRALGPMLGAAIATSLGFRAVFIAAALLFGLMSVTVAISMRD